MGSCRTPYNDSDRKLVALHAVLAVVSVSSRWSFGLHLTRIRKAETASAELITYLRYDWVAPFLQSVVRTSAQLFKMRLHTRMNVSDCLMSGHLDVL